MTKNREWNIWTRCATPYKSRMLFNPAQVVLGIFFREYPYPA